MKNINSKRLLSFILSACIIVGVIPVQVNADSNTNIEESWVDITVKDVSGKDFVYQQVYNMESSHSEGYAILDDSVNDGTKDEYYSLTISDDGSDLASSDKLTTASILEDCDYYDLGNIGSYNIWYMDASSHVYTTINSKSYYLNSIDDRITEDSNAALTWSFEVYHTDDTRAINSEGRYIKHNGTRFTIAGSAGINLFKRFDSDDITLYSLSLLGVGLYNEEVGNSTLTEEIIKNNISITKREEIDGATVDTVLSLDEIGADCSWDNQLDTKSEGIYTMTVSYKGKKLGNIVVNVKSEKEDTRDWLDVTEEDYYKRVQSLEDGKYYIITNSDNSTIDSNIGSSYSSSSLAVNATDNGYSTYNTVSITCKEKGKYSISGVSDTNNWLHGSDGSLSTVVNGTKYCVLNYEDGKGRLRILRSSMAVDVDWGVVTVSNGEVQLKEGSQYLAFDGSNYYLTEDSSNENTYFTLYSLADIPKEEVSVDGKAEYRVLTGDSSLSELYIKANTKIYRRLTYTDGSSKEEIIDWTDSRISYSWNSNLNTDSKGEYVLTVKYNDIEIKKIVVKVVSIDSYSLQGDVKVETGLNREPDLSGVELLVNYSDGTSQVLTVKDGLEVSGYNIAKEGTYTAIVSYNGINYGNVEVYVDKDTYHGLEDAINYPEYPSAGATRIDKFASNDEFEWYETGVTKVELDVAGISVKSGVDVILVTDASNSMARFYDDGVTPGEKLDEAMKAASRFAEVLLQGNSTGSSINNSLSFVTFGGYDAQSYGKDDSSSSLEFYNNRIDVTQTVFVNIQDLNKAQTSFNNTKFLSYGGEAKLQIGYADGSTISGNNSGGTNYDYAFAEAKKAVKELQDSYYNYEETGRQTIVLFMTDGAPTFYNYERVTGNDANRIYDTNLKYPDISSLYPNGNNETDWNTKSNNWYSHVSKPNAYAEELGSLVDEFYAVGFKMSEDLGTSKHCYNWDITKFTSVLHGIAGKDLTGKSMVKDVLLAENADALAEAYVDIANQLAHSGTKGKVHDIIKSDFTLEIGEYIKDLEGNDVVGVSGDKISPTIEVIGYDLYTSTDVLNGIIEESRIGERKGTYTLIEKVSFKEADGVITAYSDKVDNGVTNILKIEVVDGVDVLTISGKNFTYVKEGDVEYFDWYIDPIDSLEYALTYYAYLKGTSEVRDTGAWREDGVYDTNENATLTYIDINGYKAEKVFPIPKRPWGGALTTIEYYLVNTEGKPVNKAGEVIPFANRIRVDVENESKRTNEVKWGNSLTIEGIAYLPNGYEMYNIEAKYSLEVNTENKGNLIIDNGSLSNDTSTVWVNQGNVFSDGSYDVSATRVAFGVVFVGESEMIDTPLMKEQVVLDYGKSMQIDVFKNNSNVNKENSKYVAEVVGFKVYNEDKNVLKYIQSNSGALTFRGNYGIFSIVDSDTVEYKLYNMLSQVEKVFVVVKVTDSNDIYNSYYLCQELFVIPAPIVYYETDFAEGVFSFTQAEGKEAWSSVTDSSAEKDDEVQDQGFLSVEEYNNPYGYDSTYDDDANFSNGSSMFVEGNGVNNTYASFSFTGTGFDIISRTGKTQGMIKVQVYKKGTSTRVKSLSVLNRQESEYGDLYQIPVISIEDLDYGSYDVTVGVLDSYEYTGTSPILSALARDNDFYFDALRIYNPTGYDVDKEIVEDEVMTSDEIALSAYKTDGEAYAEIYEVRDLLTDESFDSSDTGGVNNGVIFIERYEDTHDYNFADYKAVGPNNEVYLAEGQAIVFKVSGIDIDNIASIDIAAKSINGSNVTMKAMISSDESVLNSSNTNVVVKDISSCTSQYFELLGNKNVVNSNGEAYILIINDTESTVAEDSEVGLNVLSITDIKLGYKDISLVSEEIVFSSSYSLLSLARAFSVYESKDYDIKEVCFENKSYRVFSNAIMVVETTADVTSLEIKKNTGARVVYTTSYEDTESGVRLWRVNILMRTLGRSTYTVTGYGDDGTSGNSMSVSTVVSVSSLGGWQDAKTIYKTLYNCRILSIKRSLGYKLQYGRF